MVQIAADDTRENELLKNHCNQQQRCVTSNSERLALCIAPVKGSTLVRGKIYNQDWLVNAKYVHEATYTGAGGGGGYIGNETQSCMGLVGFVVVVVFARFLCLHLIDMKKSRRKWQY